MHFQWDIQTLLYRRPLIGCGFRVSYMHIISIVVAVIAEKSDNVEELDHEPNSAKNRATKHQTIKSRAL